MATRIELAFTATTAICRLGESYRQAGDALGRFHGRCLDQPIRRRRLSNTYGRDRHYAPTRLIGRPSAQTRADASVPLLRDTSRRLMRRMDSHRGGDALAIIRIVGLRDFIRALDATEARDVASPALAIAINTGGGDHSAAMALLCWRADFSRRRRAPASRLCLSINQRAIRAAAHLMRRADWR